MAQTFTALPTPIPKPGTVGANGNSLLVDTEAPNGLRWGTSHEQVARALGWVIVTDPRFGAKGDGATDDTAAIQAAINSVSASGAVVGGTVFVPSGTFVCAGSLTIPSYVTLLGAVRSSQLRYTGTGSFVTLSSKTQVKFANLGVTLTQAGAVAFDIVNSFRCSWSMCVIAGQHVAASGATYRTQKGFYFRSNAGDNRVSDCDVNNLGIGVHTDAIQNYIVNCAFGSNWKHVYGGNIAGSDFAAGLSVLNTTMVAPPGTATTERAIHIEGSSNLFWFSHIWIEGCATGIEIGNTNGGPYSATLSQVKIAATTADLVINNGRQIRLDTIFLNKDPGATPTDITVSATVTDGVAINLVSSINFDVTSAFPTGWTVLGRGQDKLPTTNIAGPNSRFSGGLPTAPGAVGAIPVGLYAGVQGTAQVMWSDATNLWAIDLFGGNRLRGFRPGGGEIFGWDVDGNYLLGGPSGVNTGGVKKGIAFPFGTAPTSTPTNSAVLWAESSGLKYKVGSGPVTTIGAASSASAPNFPFVAAAVGKWYPSPLIIGIRTLAPTLNRLALHPFFSGAAGLTVDQLDVVVSTAGAAGSVSRLGIYQITDQTNPFAWTAGAAWATLLAEFGTTDNTVAAQRIATAGTALAIPANTWFAVGGVEQVAASTRAVGGSAGQAVYSPFGQSATSGYAASPGLALYADSVSGALPATFTPAGATNVDSGVGLHRSA